MKIEKLADFIQWVSELGDDGEHEGFMYRGVTSVSHDIVETFAYRRLEEKRIEHFRNFLKSIEI